MAGTWYEWLWGTGAGQAARLAGGAAIFAALATIDLLRHGRRATRWKEYVFLLAFVAGTIAYAVGNDMVTVAVSPEYFLAHERLPPETPNLRGVAASVAVRGAWWVGLIGGVALLMANNPMRRWPRLPWRRMYSKILYPLTAALLASAALGLPVAAGWFDGPLGVGGQGKLRAFFCVYAVHVGAYVGGGAGILAAVAAVVVQRRRAAARSGPTATS